MRRRIRLTGRKQLSKSAVNVALTELAGKPLVTMTVVHDEAFKAFPPDAVVSLRLIENKRVEVVDLGTVRKLRHTRELRARGFVAPSCQLRIADPGTGQKGLLFASTDNWTLRGDDPTDPENSKGILQFLAAETAPQPWKLDINDNDYPIVRVDKRISNAGTWARTDPVFLGLGLPMIVRQILDEIFRGDYSDDVPWVADWLRWAGAILPGEALPYREEKPVRLDYIERLLDSFCLKHDLADKLLAAVQPEVAP